MTVQFGQYQPGRRLLSGGESGSDAHPLSQAQPWLPRHRIALPKGVWGPQGAVGRLERGVCLGFPESRWLWFAVRISALPCSYHVVPRGRERLVGWVPGAHPQTPLLNQRGRSAFW